MPTYLVGPTRPYTTISSAIAAIPTSLGSQIHDVIVDSGVYTEDVVIFDKFGSSTAYVRLRGQEASHGSVSTGARIVGTISVNFARYTRLENLTVDARATFSDNSIGIGSSAPDMRLVNIIVRAGSSGVGVNVAGNNATIINCLFIGLSNSLYGVTSFGGTTTLVYNCGSYNFLNGYSVAASGNPKILARNCWAASRATDFRADGGGFGEYHASCSNNASGDSSAPGSGSLHLQTVALYAFTNVSGNNFHILQTSTLWNSGVNLSSIFTQDWDEELISVWCIGPDCLTITVTSPTAASSSLSSRRQQNSHEQKDAKAPNLKTKKPDPSPSLSDETNVDEPRVAFRKIKKGYKDGFVSVLPETAGYPASSVFVTTGNRLPIITESLSLNQSVVDLYPITSSGRQASFRVNTRNNPGGQLTFPVRTNDCIPLFQSHFQKRIGTTPAVGTTYYEFSPNRGSMVMYGSSFGTGSYTTAGSSSAFSVSLYKQIQGSSYLFTNGLCDTLSFLFESRGEAIVTSGMVFANGVTVGTGLGLPYGSFSNLPHFSGHQFTATFLDLPIISMEIESKNNIQRYHPVSFSNVLHKFGRYQVSGRAIVDASKVSLAHFGSMLGASSFQVSGTLYGDERNKMVFQMPNCVLNKYEININEDTIVMPFSCYESEDGGTAPLTIKLWTRNYSGTSFQPN
jgi:hypothetical protein